MRINEVERRVGVTKKNIRFYEEEGLLKPGRNAENGYREYGEADVHRLPDVGNGPHFAYILRDREWKGGE